MSRLPKVGGDTGNWGEILNDFLTQSHDGDGKIKDGVITAAKIASGVIPSTPQAIGAEPAGLSSGTQASVAATVEAATNSDALAAIIANPETTANSAVVDAVASSLGGGLSGISRIEKGTIINLNTARPVGWVGVVEWLVAIGSPPPTNMIDGDFYTEVDVVAIEDLQGYSDSFNRADQPLSTVAGRGTRSWHVASSSGTPTLAVSSNALIVTSASTGNAIAVADCKVHKGTLSVIIRNMAAIGAMGVVFNYIDDTNYYYVSRYSSAIFRYAVYKSVAGTRTMIATGTSGITNPSTVTMTDGDQIDVIAGSATNNYIINVNGVTIFNFTDSSLPSTGTYYGVYTVGSGAVSTTAAAESASFTASA